VPSTAAATDPPGDPVLDLVSKVKDAQLPPRKERRRIRVDAHVSGRRAARALGVNPMTFFKWENGDITPTLENAIAYRRLLDGLAEAAE
jgi:DNA-binding XRE family transcriptional regulator